MKEKTLRFMLCSLCLILGTFLAGCFSDTPNANLDISMPETTVPETTAPETTAPETTAPETTAPETTVPETTVPETTVPEITETKPVMKEYVLSLNTKKFHHKTCRWVANIKPENKGSFTGDRDQLISQGYEACGTCHP